MRDNPQYALTDAHEVAELVRAHPWCRIVSHVPGSGLVASHYPMLVDEDADGLTLLSHVGRPDERLHRLGTGELLVIAEGPHGYISPSWYGLSPAVPTWNFTAAHLTGTPEILGDDENLEVLARLVAHFEGEVPQPQLLTGANAEYAERIVAGTVGFRMRVDRIVAKRKLSQDKPAAVRERIIRALREPGPYANPALADDMAAHAGETA
ncbi:FMN-binding negative transcriptional regulator [Microbacterium sediminis]|uniref:Transcriptional regulator n=1 Tax=Microbacterium sediminis TaxID=904291 RepID=A0A1B9N8A6_9MICO|nr:FMN-binding negative transcriptional regulator [Microbacterium sediminis]OCG72818.1 transcriptional regulator [Microbacterium sediminis]QBR73508.1 FMN-binding negative transcriptional regulator [Microbacterium sediminis]